MKLAVFDLDYTIWDPEMYQLYGTPKLRPIDSKPFKGLSPELLDEAKTNKDGYILADSSNSPIRVFKGAAYALDEIEKMKAMGHNIEAAVASKTDEPGWAKICLNHLVINNAGTTLTSCFRRDLVEISFGSKTNHFRRLHAKTGIPYENMAFFDNEYGNIRDVSRLGVKCYYTPDGMMKEHWDKAKADFGMAFNSCEADLN
eukprot:CAMPEP_0183291382 /NCGR_PEP_ID=MMETSP0160_2-20130417/827_1 /TAXON_ID=2839 ORGANISM="Odontella Sinensis, Strain Grunow 1884" /NCGR_SAMPLE_ID=MMETSP0160_2 /ASSEMBLY_ACC=CAM_ASM_000250 /LENGTH=200 /DNA_ID=CAMNT_0025452181 /DNA_START=130 /DNA_END=732 /DNA_ORIENTATION=-